MEIILGILAFLVAVLAVLQGWNIKNRRNSNPSNKIDSVALINKLDIIIAKLGKMEQRLNDIWDKIKE